MFAKKCICWTSDEQKNKAHTDKLIQWFHVKRFANYIYIDLIVRFLIINVSVAELTVVDNKCVKAQIFEVHMTGCFTPYVRHSKRTLIGSFQFNINPHVSIFQ